MEFDILPVSPDSDDLLMYGEESGEAESAVVYPDEVLKEPNTGGTETGVGVVELAFETIGQDSGVPSEEGRRSTVVSSRPQYHLPPLSPKEIHKGVTIATEVVNVSAVLHTNREATETTAPPTTRATTTSSTAPPEITTEILSFDDGYLEVEYRDETMHIDEDYDSREELDYIIDSIDGRSYHYPPGSK